VKQNKVHIKKGEVQTPPVGFSFTGMFSHYSFSYDPILDSPKVIFTNTKSLRQMTQKRLTGYF